MMNLSDPAGPGYLPLYNASGREALDGQIVCRTCHVSHGRVELLQMMADKTTLGPEHQNAVRAQVRPYIPPNLCSQCHGEKGRSNFLHFHDAAMRKAASEMPAELPAQR